MLPTGTYGMNGDRGSRSTSVASTSTGVSMMCCPSGSFSLPSTRRNMPPDGIVLGTVVDSTTLIQGVHFIAPKYSAAGPHFLLGHRAGKDTHELRVGFLGVCALAQPILEIGHPLDELGDRQTRHPRIFGTPF